MKDKRRREKFNNLNEIYFNKSEFEYAKKNVVSNPLEAKRRFEDYFEKYPKDYLSYSYYINCLIKLNLLDEAEKIYNYVNNLIQKDSNFLTIECKSNKFQYDMIYTKLRLLTFRGKIKEAYYFIINNQDKIKEDVYKPLLLYCKTKLNILVDENIQHHKYIINQIYHYQENNSQNHVKKHLYDYTINEYTFDKAIFNEDFPVEMIITEIRKYIPNNKRINKDYIYNSYVFKYDKCGVSHSEITDYFVVDVFNNTDNIITIYPVINATSNPYIIDLNYLKSKDEDTGKVKIKSQIEKFKEKYHI